MVSIKYPLGYPFQWVNSSLRWPKYWSFSFNIIPSKEHPGLISFRMDWLDLLAVPGTLKSLLQHHSSKASILRCSAFFTVQLSHPYMTTGKTIVMASLTWWTWVWVNSGSWWWTGRPGVLQVMGSQRVRHDWVTELNWTDRLILKEISPEYSLKDWC